MLEMTLAIVIEDEEKHLVFRFNDANCRKHAPTTIFHGISFSKTCRRHGKK